MSPNKLNKRFYEVVKHTINDGKIVYNAGQIDSNQRHRKIQIEMIERNLFLKKDDKLKFQKEIKEYQDIELKRMFDVIRKELKTHNVLSIADLTEEGIILIEYDVISSDELIKYSIDEDENGMKYITQDN